MNDKTITIDDNFETILICAVRYACGRHTYMPGLVQDWIIGHCKGKLSANCLTVMLRDIQEQTAMSERIEGRKHDGSTSLFEHDLMLKLANWCGEELKHETHT